MTFQIAHRPGLARMYERAGVKYDEAAAIRQTDSLNALFAKAEGLHAQRAAVVAEGKAAAQGLIPATATSVVISLSSDAAARLATDQAASPDGATPASATPATYAKGSVESENIQMAVGMSEAARTNIETLNLGVSVYNGAMRSLNDTAKFDTLLAERKSHIADALVYVARKSIQDGLRFASGALGKMNAEFAVTGTAVTRTPDGLLKTGDYVQSKGESGWSVSVRSTGEVKATANGVDVSGKVSDSSSSGFKWSDVIAKRRGAEATAAAAALEPLTRLTAGADESGSQAREDDTVGRSEAASEITASQIALQTLTSGRMLDTSA